MKTFGQRLLKTAAEVLPVYIIVFALWMMNSFVFASSVPCTPCQEIRYSTGDSALDYRNSTTLDSVNKMQVCILVLQFLVFLVQGGLVIAHLYHINVTRRMFDFLSSVPSHHHGEDEEESEDEDKEFDLEEEKGAEAKKTE